MTDNRKSDTCSGFRDVCASVQGVLEANSLLRHVSKSKLRQFSFDVTVVAFGVRCGYLFDVFGLRTKRTTLKDFLEEVLLRLRQTHPAFETVTLLYDPASEQLFFVSVPRFRTYCEPDSGRLSGTILSWVSFIEVRGAATETCPPPVRLESVFRAVALELNAQGTPPVVISLPGDEDRSMGDMVAFAACILEFPVAYVPISEPTGGAFLAGVPLDVYDCVLVRDTGRAAEAQARSEVQSLIKFSCPQAIGLEVPELSPKSLVDRLSARFAERVEHATSFAFVVSHFVETLDRVAM
ncbi:hypothetical protein C8T65DRAFT_659832 [Cerioporus squamosus]|nr:hypothetical protein C8T65DRAFT_659832 [Cerioporus squamosus]